MKPSFPVTNILSRNPHGEPARSLYLTNDIVREVLTLNDYRRLRLIAAGTKIFTRQEGGFGKVKKDVDEDGEEAQYRLLSEGLPVVLPHVQEDSIIDAQLGALRILVEAYYPLLSGFAEPFRSAVEAKRKSVLYLDPVKPPNPGPFCSPWQPCCPLASEHC